MTNYHELIREHYIGKRKKNPSFSLRAFAKQLGLTPGGLSRLMNGKLDISYERAVELCSRMNFKDDETENFLNLVQLKKAKNSLTKEQILKKIERSQGTPMFDLSVDHFRMISEWYPMVILKIAGEAKTDRTKQSIAKRLGITSIEANQAVGRLKRLNLIVETEGQVVRVPKQEILAEFRSENDAAKNYYLDVLNKVRSNIENNTANSRSIATKVLLFDSEQLETIRKLTYEYQDKLGKLSEKSKKKERIFQAFSTVFEI